MKFSDFVCSSIYVDRANRTHPKGKRGGGEERGGDRLIPSFLLRRKRSKAKTGATEKGRRRGKKKKKRERFCSIVSAAIDRVIDPQPTSPRRKSGQGQSGKSGGEKGKKGGRRKGEGHQHAHP